MQKFHSVSKRALAMVLTLAIMLPMLTSTLAFGVAAVGEPISAEKTDGQVIAENYDLTAEERALLNSGYLVGATHNYHVPGVSSNLISVDIDEKYIQMKPFESDGLIWNPVSVDIVINQDQILETISKEDFDGNKAYYATDSSAFSVWVQYECEDEIDEDTQELLLNAADILKSDLEKLAALLDSEGKIQQDLKSFANFSMMKPPADSLNTTIGDQSIFELLLGDGYKVKAVVWGQEVVSAVTFQPAEKPYAQTLWDQLDANEGKLNLQVLSKEYEEADSKTKFLLDRLDEIQAEAALVIECMQVLSADNKTFDSIASLVPEENPIKDGVADYVVTMKTLAVDLGDYTEDDGWKIEVQGNPLKSELSDDDYFNVDVFVAILKDDLKGSSTVVKNPLTIGKTQIQFNMSMYNVEVEIELNVIKNNELFTYGAKNLVLTFAQNASKAEILEAIEDSGFEAAALAAWGDIYVAEHFEKTVTNLPANLTDDVQYKITYTPKNYAVNYLGDATYHPYGYQLKLPKHENSNLAYDYKVNGAYYAQGTVVNIDKDVVITRSEGKAYTSYPVVDKLIVENFFSGTDEGSKKASAILTSGALISDWYDLNVDVRLPDKDGLFTLVAGQLTVGTYASSYEDFYWVPVFYTVNTKNGSTKYPFEGNNQVTITEADYESVDIEYRLTFSNISGFQEDILDLPGELAAEAEGQIAALDALMVYYDQMGSIKDYRFAFALLANEVKKRGDLDKDGVIEDADLAELYGAIVDFDNDCFADDDSLIMYNLMTGYDNDGLAYYYKNSEAFISEIDKLNACLEVIGKNTTVLKSIISETLGGVLGDKLDAVLDTMDDIDRLSDAVGKLKANLKKPHFAIDLNSANLDVLADALEMQGTVPQVDERTMYLSTSFNQAADGKSSFIVQVQGATIINPVFTDGHKFDANDINAIIAAVEAELDKNEANYPELFYNCNYDKQIFLDMVGRDAKDFNGIIFGFNYSLKEFTVKVEDVDTDTIVDFSAGNRKVTLPSSPSSAFRYDYVIFGKVVPSGEYKLTDDDMAKIAKAGGCTITKIVTDVKRESYETLVDELNAAAGSDLIQFALILENDEYSLVMKVDASNPNALTGAIMGLAQKLISYDYVALDNHEVIYKDGADKNISIQALINAVLYSGFSSDKLIGMMDANGKVNNMTMPGKVIHNEEIGKAGALLADVFLSLGKNKDNPEHQLPMYITVGAVSSEIVQVRNLFADRLNGYFEFETDNGEVSLNITLPNKAYEAYLAVLLATESLDLSSVNSINEQVAFGFMQDLITPLMESDASVKSIQNTLAKFGYNIDLTGYEDAFELVRKVYLRTEFEYNKTESTYDTSLKFSIDSYIEKIDLDIITDLIVEKGGHLYIPVSASLLNLDKDYEAIYFDKDAAGITNKVGFVEDLSAKLGSISGTAVVVLLDNVNDSLKFNTTTVLNLNGFTVNGDIVGKGQVTIIDNTMEGNDPGQVTGTVSGNVVVAGGKYSANVSAYIPSGYKQDADGVVANKYINIIKDGNENVTVELDASLFNEDCAFDAQSLVVDIVAELLLNEFSTNTCVFEGEELFTLTIDDVVSIYTAKDRRAALMSTLASFGNIDSLNKILNLVIDDVIDFETVSESLNNDLANGSETPVLSYELVTGTWDAKFEYVEETDSIDLDILTKDQKVRNLNVVLSGTKEDKQQVADMVELLAQTTETELNVILGRKSGNLVLNVAIDGKVVMDLSDDAGYAVIMGVVVADGIGAPANKDLVLGLDAYFTDGTTTKLEAAINKLTVAQIIKAVKNYNKNDSLSSMLNNLGLGNNDADVEVLEAKLHNTIVLLSRVLNKVNVNGPKTVIGNLLNAQTNAYTFDKSNVIRRFSASGITCEIEVTEFFASLQLFDVTPDGPQPPVINYSELEAKIAEIEAAGLVESDYTEESWDAFWAALNYAKNCVENKNAASQDEVKSVLRTLTHAYENLEEKQPPVVVVVDYSRLEAKVAEIEAAGLVESNYTAESWNKFYSVFTEAKEMLENRNAESTNDVNTLLVKLNVAYSNLVKVTTPEVTVDYNELREQIAKAEALNKDDYTPESWEELMDALEAARDALDSKDQEEVNKLADALLAAINGLKKQESQEPEPPVEEDPDENKGDGQEEKGGNAVIWIVIICVVVLGAVAGAVIFFTNRKKQQLADSIPLVDVVADDKADAAATEANESENKDDNGESKE